MIHPKKLVEIAKRLQKTARLSRRRVGEATFDEETCTTLVADKGHFVAYTTDGTRFMVPLEYLSSKVFSELLQISEHEFGLPSERPIVLPCDTMLMEYVVSLLRRGVSEEVERALLDFVMISSQSNCSMAPLVGQSQQLAIDSF